MAVPQLSVRQRHIMALIEADGAQQIEDLAQRFGLTTQTIRRDINVLCDLGQARRFHGGVDLPVMSRNISVNARSQLNSSAKRRIALYIASQITDGSTVFLGIGSTVQFVAAALRERSGLTVVTNNIDVARTLGEAPDVELHLTGGIWRANDQDVVGPDAVKFFGKFYASFAVIGAGGLSAEHGVLDFSYGEAQIANAIIENSRVRFLAADFSKWGRDASIRVAPFDQFTHLVTDRRPDDEATQAALKQSGVKVVVCDEAGA
ncbi:DeoR family glycerol-3-phosphate regulon repressor [Devosia sp. UYZn731]|uniref:DeoR/GlpR family DNA-binding transcription regulator n=1 Tax=Devosia sp. UYZn731 TaxID=3156345 RepID=UPI0033960645